MRKRATKRRKSNRTKRRNINKKRIVGGVLTRRQRQQREVAVALAYDETMNILNGIVHNPNLGEARTRKNYILNRAFINYIQVRMESEENIDEITRFIRNYGDFTIPAITVIGVNPRPSRAADANPLAHQMGDTDTNGDNQDPPFGWPDNVGSVTPQNDE